jgi:thioester reductase-like protein
LALAIAELKEGLAASSLPVMTTPVLAAEAVLDPAISVAAGPMISTPAARRQGVLLTGATGFLGAFLLAEILRQRPEVRVHCLVRATPAGATADRLRAHLSSFGLWEEAFASRIVVQPGDLAKPLFGLSPGEWQRLGSEIDEIYHNGAWVNLFYAYSTLKPTNVLGTQEVLRLASLAPIKPVHYVSTTGVFFSAGGPAPDLVDERTGLAEIAGLIGGYAQSKWVAEKLVRLAGDRGVPVTVYRPGRIGGHSQTGLGNADDLLFRILKGSLQLGCAPNLDSQVELSPVDFVSRALVHLSLQPASAGQTFHLINPRLVPWDQVLAWLGELGSPLERLPWDDWLQALNLSAERSADNALYPLLPVLRAEPSDADESAGEAREPRFACHRTLAALAGSGIDCPPLDPGLLRLYLADLGRPGAPSIS